MEQRSYNPLAEQSRAEQSRAKQSKAEQSRAKQSRAARSVFFRTYLTIPKENRESSECAMRVKN